MRRFSPTFHATDPTSAFNAPRRHVDDATALFLVRRAKLGKRRHT
jgi:hypothetical protein